MRVSNEWKQRLLTPNYSVKDAARFAATSPQTISNWQKMTGSKPGALALRKRGAALSYLQLIELGVVATMRKAGVPLKSIKAARSYLASTLDTQHPFAEMKFKTTGKDLIVESEQLTESDKNKLVIVSQGGQYAWKKILQDLLKEFEYSENGDEMVVRWNVRGVDNPIVIDPRISFGSPSVEGIQTAVIADRWRGGDTAMEIAEDFGLEIDIVNKAIDFETKQTELAA